ncbi:MAG TPA: 7TM diverse intracellular signaling domain-containing protein [Puia sp.]
MKVRCIIILFFISPFLGIAQTDSSSAIAVNGFTNQLSIINPVSCFIDSAKLSDAEIFQSNFNIPYSSFSEQFNKNYFTKIFWLQFGIKNNSDSNQTFYLFCGDINYITAYFESADNKEQIIQSGSLKGNNDAVFYNLSVLPIIVSPKQSGKIFLKLEQKTQEFDFDGISIYNQTALNNSLFADYKSDRTFVFFELLFQGFLLCQIFYVLFQWIIIKRKEYLYYFFYLSIISLYFLSKYESIYGISLLFSRYPILTVYLSKTFLILPYFLYFRFVRSFLEMPLNYPRLNKWIIRIEKFLLFYLIFDLSFIIITFNQKIQLEIYTYIFSLLFLTVASFIVYLFRQKKVLIYYILTGSLFVGIGNILGLIFTYLDNNLHVDLGFHNMLIFSQIGIVLEIICFTAGLSYKSKSAEEEKIKSQQNLIEQLKANEVLQSRMQNIRNKIAQDLHDDIGSTLSSISILSDLALKEKNIIQANEVVSEIKNNSIILMEKMDDIVWSINPKNDSLENLLIRIKRFATQLFEAKEIDYTIEIDENIAEVKLPMDYRQHIYLILKEAINNLVKYSQAIKAEIKVCCNNNLLELYVIDNGKGFIQQESITGNGILSMKSRALLMNAELIINSELNKGTEILLKVRT